MLKLTKRSNALLLWLLLGSNDASALGLWQAYELARENDIELQQAASDHGQASTLIRLARADLLPSLSLEAEVGAHFRDGDQTGEEDYDARTLGLQLTQPLYDRAGTAKLGEAGARVLTADQGLRQAQQDLILRVAERYFSVLLQKDALAFARAEQAAIHKQLQEAESRMKVRMIKLTDVLDIRAANDLAITRELAAKNQVNNALHAIEEVVGLLPETIAPMGDEVPLNDRLADNVDYWLQLALQNNPSLAAAESASEAARRGVEVERSGRYPRLDLVARHDYRDGLPRATSADSRSSESYVGVRLSLSLFEGGRVSASTDSASHGYRKAMLEVDRIRRALKKEINNAALGVQVSVSQVRAFKQALHSMEAALEATDRGYEVGARTVVDVLAAQRELYRARRDYSRALYEYIINGLKLKHAAGVIAEQDLRQVDAWCQDKAEERIALL